MRWSPDTSDNCSINALGSPARAGMRPIACILSVAMPATCCGSPRIQEPTLAAHIKPFLDVRQGTACRQELAFCLSSNHLEADLGPDMSNVALNTEAISAPAIAQRNRALALSSLAFTVCFAVWTLFSIVGVKIKQELGLDDAEFGLLIATPVLTGALSRV